MGWLPESEPDESKPEAGRRAAPPATPAPAAAPAPGGFAQVPPMSSHDWQTSSAAMLAILFRKSWPLPAQDTWPTGESSVRQLFGKAQRIHVESCSCDSLCGLTKEMQHLLHHFGHDGDTHGRVQGTHA